MISLTPNSNSKRGGKRSRAEKSGSEKKRRKARRSWLTTDEQEIELRRERAAAEKMRVLRPDGGVSWFADYRVLPDASEKEGREYIVEIRALDGPGNFCTCPDFAKNYLGTCKHVEKVLMRFEKSFRKEGRSPFIEVFVDAAAPNVPRAAFPPGDRRKGAAFIRRYLDARGAFKAPWEDSLLVFLRDYDRAPAAVRRAIRVSRGIRALAARIEERRGRELARKNFEKVFDSEAFLRLPLYDYQREGMLHLAFTGRAILADEMGLGKTVQAVAAAKLMRDLYGIERVLVVCPASLKTEWEEQIRKFTSLSYTTVFGLRKKRLAAYQSCSSFFVITNYEQILRDEQDINRTLQPDLVILDEAQRIKNWRTKTAQSIKRLESRFAFLLTGTPLENRIDEIYSLVELVDGRLLGSLFRFNREFYRFDEDGKVVGLRNLRKLHEVLKPIMLRRRKDQIEDQLPERIDNNYFVPMTPEQRKRYAEYEYQVSILSNIARRRPLTREEFERLQLCLACMRMLCDTVYILDSEVRTSPKVEELYRIINDIHSNDPRRKIIVFSEWVRMLELVRNMLEDNGIEYAWHTGSVPQQKRREEINRFKTEEHCTVFLSSESGSLGLNLQVASVVINLDLPWNPARLEQRIARCWRKHQSRTVNVINLVSENTIEHRMLATLRYKQRLSDSVLDGQGDWAELEQPEARSKFMERLGEILNTRFAAEAKSAAAGPAEAVKAAAVPAALPPAELFRQEAEIALEGTLRLCKIAPKKEDANRIDRVLAVTPDPGKARPLLDAALSKSGQSPESVDATLLTPEQYRLLQELAAKGIITFNDSNMQTVLETDAVTPPEKDDREKRRAAAEPYLEKARRNLRMAAVLEQGDFPVEAAAAARKALDPIAVVLEVLASADVPESPGAALARLDLDAVMRAAPIPPESAVFLRGALEPPTAEAEAAVYLRQARQVADQVESAVLRLAL